MIKYGIVAFSLLALVLCSSFFPVTVNITQTVPESTVLNSSFLVEVAIDKGDLGLTGTGKFKEQLPPGLTVVPVDDEGAKVNIDAGGITFSWDSLPSKDVINISFRVNVGSSAKVHLAILIGRFTYMINGQKIETDGTPSYLFLKIESDGTPTYLTSSSPPVEKTDTASSVKKKTEATRAKKIADSINAVIAAANSKRVADSTNAAIATANTINNSTNVTPSVMASQKEINYRVQIMALNHPVNVSYFSTKRGLSDHVNTELGQGFTKYTIGGYPEYQLCRNAREDVKNKGIVGPFIVAYNSGVRITVQEALMISHQKWYR